MNPTLEGEVVENQNLDRYLEEVTTQGFPLGLLARMLATVKALAYMAGAAMIAFPAKALFLVSVDTTHDMLYFGALMLMLDILAWLIVLYFLTMALVNILAALSGRMTIEGRLANDSAERIRRR